MKTFDELFNEAATVADRRKVVFNQLIEKTVSEILPKFCETCVKFDLKTVYVKTNRKAVSISEVQVAEYEQTFYAIAIDLATKEIANAEWKWRSEEYEKTGSNFTFDEVTFTRTGIVEFVKTLNSRLESYVKRFTIENEVAEKY